MRGSHLRHHGTHGFNTNSSARSGKDEDSIHIDLQAAAKQLLPEQMEFNAEIFSHCAASSGGRLTRRGIQHAMAEAEIVVSSYAEQRKLRQVQEEVIQHCRGQHNVRPEDDVTNPLTHSTGFWHLEEFLLMVAGMNHLGKREISKEHEMLAAEHGLELATVDELKLIFGSADEDGSGEISIHEMQQLLTTADLNLTDKELKVLLGCQSLEDELTFPAFLRAMSKVEDFFQLDGEANSLTYSPH